MPNLVVEADRGLLRIALSNLLGNAWKFTSKRTDCRIELGLRSHETQKVYFVRDNGAGFDMRYADKLFGPFQRLHDGNKLTFQLRERLPDKVTAVKQGRSTQFECLF